MAAVGGVEAFGENDERGSGFGGFEHAGAGAGEVGGFVGTWGGGLEKEVEVVVGERLGGRACCELHESEL